MRWVHLLSPHTRLRLLLVLSFLAGWSVTLFVFVLSVFLALFVFAVLHFHCSLVEVFMYSMTNDVHMRKCKYVFCIYAMRDYPEQSRAFYHNTECISIAVRILQHNSLNNILLQITIWLVSKVSAKAGEWQPLLADIETCPTGLCLKSCRSTCSLHRALYISRC